MKVEPKIVNGDSIEDLFIRFEDLVDFAHCLIRREEKATGIISSKYGIDVYVFNEFSDLNSFRLQLESTLNDFITAIASIQNQSERIRGIKLYIGKLHLLAANFVTSSDGFIRNAHTEESIDVVGRKFEGKLIDEETGYDDGEYNNYLQATFNRKGFYPFVTMQFDFCQNAINRLSAMADLGQISNVNSKPITLSSTGFSLVPNPSGLKDLRDLYEYLHDDGLVRCNEETFINFFKGALTSGQTINWQGSQSDLAFLLKKIKKDYKSRIKSPKNIYQTAALHFKIQNSPINPIKMKSDSRGSAKMRKLLAHLPAPPDKRK